MKQVLLAHNGNHVQVDCLAPSLFRVQVSVDGKFRESPLLRYGVFKKDWPECEAKFVKSKTAATFKTAAAELSVSLADGRATLKDAAGKTLLAGNAAPRSSHDTGFDVSFRLADDRLYGMGDNGRDNIQRRGQKYNVIIRNVACYIPIPYLMSSNGWALLMNTTWHHMVDAGATDPDTLDVHAPKGDLDYYLFAGDGLPDLLDKYTALTGRPAILPRWAYGLTFVCDERGVRARDVLYEAFEFRRQDIPCDIIGLEPGWMETNYDFSTEKKWSQERFHIPFWLKGDDHATFAAGIKNMGFKLSLWLCCDYDFSDYEELQLGKQAAAEHPQPEPDNEFDLFKDPHFCPAYMDKLTKRGERWFEHLKKFVDDGARAFKLDGANQVCFHPDRKWANGMEDAEMHNLYPLLYNKEMTGGFTEHTNKRPMVNSADGYAGIQQYSASWAGDTGGGAKPLVSILNHALSGHSNTSADLQVFDSHGLHFGFLQPWSQVLSWHQYNQPWFQGERLCAMFKFYAKLRYRLLPYIYSLAHQAHRTGLPIARPMPLAFPDDPKSDALTLQYMLGDAFLVGAFNDTIHLPAGEWTDYWTGERHVGPKTIPAAFPEDRGGPLFVKAGSIVPMAPEMAFSNQRPLDAVTLDIHPGADASFTLSEDDGETLEHRNGAVATTLFELSGKTVIIHPRLGSYAGMPENRSYELAIHSDKELKLKTPGFESAWNPAAKVLAIKGVMAKKDKIALTLAAK